MGNDGGDAEGNTFDSSDDEEADELAVRRIKQQPNSTEYAVYNFYMCEKCVFVLYDDVQQAQFLACTKKPLRASTERLSVEEFDIRSSRKGSLNDESEVDSTMDSEEDTVEDSDDESEEGSAKGSEEESVEETEEYMGGQI
ncbi:hypothetical protein F441_07843 [Phytophthora nicotianae CJ01A1]|uniref:Uncharacterized protein n=3 Tax=Phytophthora nicotianae TaxID=4792 RepID=W2X512_PHYNI|nr:hypothetical protein L915_07704 [Phytophthora nicotianae]ETP17821.1 hypothetical protein F441_07843 [Phytophthora nicotianae CJ01A1]